MAAYFVVNSYDCFILDLTAFPKILEKYLNGNNHDFVFLYGKSICGSCPAGRYIYNNLRRKREIIFLTPEDFSNNDINNLIDSFGLKGKIIKGDTEVRNFAIKIFSCAKVKESFKNIHFKLGENGKIRKIITF